MQLSNKIRSFRKERSLTQEQLAQALGITAGAVYKWEANLSTPDISLLVELADLFDTSVDVLLGHEVRNNRQAEADKLLARYPNCFEIVYHSAELYVYLAAAQLRLGEMDGARESLRTAKAAADWRVYAGVGGGGLLPACVAGGCAVSGHVCIMEIVFFRGAVHLCQQFTGFLRNRGINDGNEYTVRIHIIPSGKRAV
ncbi:MAG: helix-turn-helix domain-containing protein [Oscillospiraceae bacterium]|nr:helix-turn-helix domain-containing protein [Oscillospiraceae bacterium]